jgi:hypothetical protein
VTDRNAETSNATDFLDRVDRAVVADIMRWSSTLPALNRVNVFRSDHAAYGLYLAEAYLEGWAGRDRMDALDEEGRFLFALDSAFWWWFDDLVDDHVHEPQPAVAWEALERVFGVGVPLPPPEGVEPGEVAFLRKLSAAIEARPGTLAADHAWWLECTIRTIRGFREEDVAMRARIADPAAPWTYAEQLEVGFASCTLLNVTATVGALMKLGLGDRHPLEPTAAERLLCLAARVENDRMSFAKEASQSIAPSTAVILARSFPADRVLRFLEEQQDGYERRLRRELAKLGDRHPFSLLTEGILRTHRAFYAARPERYVK